MSDIDKEDEAAEAYGNRLQNARKLVITMALSTVTAVYAGVTTDPEGGKIIEDEHLDLTPQYESLEAAARHLVAVLQES